MDRTFLKRFFVSLDELLGSDLYEKLLSVEAKWRNFFSLILRSVGPWIVRWKYRIGVKGKNPLKLHLGCGNRHIEGYVNIDWRKTAATDLVCDVRKLPYPDNSIRLIETYHVIEHFPRHDLPIVLKEWHRVLVPGGSLIIECPDFDGAVSEYLEGNEKRLDNIFGLQRFHGDVHLFGYNFERLVRSLEQAGFEQIEKGEPQDYHAKDEPCLRVSCVKANHL